MPGSKRSYFAIAISDRVGAGDAPSHTWAPCMRLFAGEEASVIAYGRRSRMV